MHEIVDVGIRSDRGEVPKQSSIYTGLRSNCHARTDKNPTCMRHQLTMPIDGTQLKTLSPYCGIGLYDYPIRDVTLRKNDDIVHDDAVVSNDHAIVDLGRGCNLCSGSTVGGEGGPLARNDRVAKQCVEGIGGISEGDER